MAVISFEEVSKSFRGINLYSGVTFDIEEGSITSIAGANGSGKSVLFRLMCGFVAPDSGAVSVDARFMSSKRVFPEKFGIIIDRPGFLAGETGLSNLRKLAAIRREITDNRIRETMELVGLDPDLKSRVRHYSLGMKQKLALAQALMESPEVLLLDEPFNGLDAESVANIKHLLRERNAQGTTIVFTSHNNVDIDELATERLEINNRSVIRLAT